MPWQCSKCATEVPDDALTCPGCQAPKTAWTMVPEQTRTFVMVSKKFELLQEKGQGLQKAEAAPAISRRRAQRLAREGQRPGPQELLTVRLHPRDAKDLTITLGLGFAARALEERPVEVERPSELGENEVVDVPVLLVYGPREATRADAFSGLTVIDVTEDTPAGHAPTVEVTALERRPKDLPVVPVAEQRRAYLLEMEDVHFNHGSAVFLPGDPRPEDSQESDTLSGLAALRVALSWAMHHPAQRLLAAGHTDRSGSEEINLRISRERADSVLSLLRGERDRWVAIAEQRNEVQDVQQILHWAKASFGWPCDPGAVDGVSGPKTRAAVEALQRGYNGAFNGSISEDGVVGPQTWGAVFDCYEDALARALELEDLSTPRASLSFLEPAGVGCGEHHPVEAARPDDTQSSADRRVELLFFDEEEVPPLPCHAGEGCDPGACQLYAGGYRFERVPAWIGTRVVRLRVVDHAGAELGGRRYELVVSGEVHSGVVPEDGIVEHPVPDDLTEAKLSVYPHDGSEFAVVWNLTLRQLHPVDTVSGVQDRLKNLGYYRGKVDDDLGPVTQRALREFQHRCGISSCGEPTEETRSALCEAHRR